MNVKACYEGYEAEKLYINGGDTHIVASDDAINAAAADLGDDGADAAADASAEAPGSEGGTLPDGMEAPEGAPDGMTPPDGVNGMDGEAPELPEGAETPDATGGTPPSGAPQRNGEGANERELNGGAPDNAFAEGGAGGMGMGDENCLIQINGGYTVLDAQGDGVDSNGSVEITGGVLLVCGPTHGGRLVHGGQAVRHGAGHQPRVRRRRHVFAGHRRHRDRRERRRLHRLRHGGGRLHHRDRRVNHRIRRHGRPRRRRRRYARRPRRRRPARHARRRG